MRTPLPLGDNLSIEQCRNWLREVCRWLGPGFHPDTRGEEYVSSSPGSIGPGPLLTAEEVTLYNRGIEGCFAVLGDEVYVVGLDEQQRMLRAEDTLSSRETEPRD